MDNFTIAESYTLPSKGMVYSKKVNPNVRLRSMTTQEEMMRLGHSDLPNKLLCEIIESCLVEKPGIPVYDLCLGDYQFLLYKLRTVTYGPEYKVQSICPYCKQLNEQVINLDDLEVVEYSEGIERNLHITLPVSQKKVDLKLQSPRALDEIKVKKDELLSRSQSAVGDPAFLYNLESVIAKVDNEILDPVKLEAFVRNLSMKDANYILKSVDKVAIGVNPLLDSKCSKCGGTYKDTMPFTNEFFRPSID